MGASQTASRLRSAGAPAYTAWLCTDETYSSADDRAPVRLRSVLTAWLSGHAIGVDADTVPEDGCSASVLLAVNATVAASGAVPTAWEVVLVRALRPSDERVGDAATVVASASDEGVDAGDRLVSARIITIAVARRTAARAAMRRRRKRAGRRIS